VRVHGPIAGTWLVVRRLSRCHPFGPAGHDPVPAPPVRKEA
jgi:putative component of membrane protein insertase Oxa1/YidC/SpoIIIJ protein YidD